MPWAQEEALGPLMPSHGWKGCRGHPLVPPSLVPCFIRGAGKVRGTCKLLDFIKSKELLITERNTHPSTSPGLFLFLLKT